MKPGQLSLGYDCDGVLYDLVVGYEFWMVEHRAFPVEKVPHPGGPARIWNFYEDYGQTTAEFLAEWAAAVHSGVLYKASGADKEMVRTVRSLLDIGHQAHLVTARMVPGAEMECRLQTFEWLAEVGLPFDSVTFSEDKTVVECDLFLEDHAANYTLIDRAGEAVPLLWDAPYNAELTAARRIRSWEEWHDLVGVVTAAVDASEAHLMDVCDRQEVVAEAVDLWYAF